MLPLHAIQLEITDSVTTAAAPTSMSEFVVIVSQKFILRCLQHRSRTIGSWNCACNQVTPDDSGQPLAGSLEPLPEYSFMDYRSPALHLLSVSLLYDSTLLDINLVSGNGALTKTATWSCDTPLLARLRCYPYTGAHVNHCDRATLPQRHCRYLCNCS